MVQVERFKPLAKDSSRNLSRRSGSLVSVSQTVEAWEIGEVWDFWGLAWVIGDFAFLLECSRSPARCPYDANSAGSFFVVCQPFWLICRPLKSYERALFNGLGVKGCEGAERGKVHLEISDDGCWDALEVLLQLRSFFAVSWAIWTLWGPIKSYGPGEVESGVRWCPGRWFSGFLRMLIRGSKQPVGASGCSSSHRFRKKGSQGCFELRRRVSWSSWRAEHAGVVRSARGRREKGENCCWS